jgi:hypothetical protein
MVNNMSIDKNILQELERYRQINKYINEQEVPPPPGGELPPPPEGEAVTPTPGVEAGAPPPAEPTVVDPATDPEVEKIDASGKSEETTDDSTGTEELEITDLVTSQKNVETKQEEYFTKLFSQLEGLESKLSEMDKIMTTLNSLEAKVEKYRPKTPQEKLELRSLDSGPFNQKLTDFFDDKQEDIEKSGKNEYVLTSDEVEDFSPSEIKNTFNEFDDTVQFPFQNLK